MVLPKIALFSLIICILQDNATNAHDNNFRDIASSKHYVDKTSFIKHFHSHDDPIFFSAPRQFGKTLTLTMLKAFYGINIDANGTLLQKTSTQNYEIFAKLANKATHINSSVFKDRIFFNANFGTRPVLFLSLKDLDVRNMEKFLDSFKTMVLDLYSEHAYVLKSKLKSADEKHFSFYLNLKDAKSESLVISGQTLTGILFRYFKKRCVVLVDDLDTPVMKLLTSPSGDGKSIFRVLEAFISSFLQENGAVEKVFLAGNTDLARSYLKGGSNIAHHSFAKNNIAKFFGFTDEEVKRLIENSAFDLKQINCFYGGYRVGYSAVKIYNPYSVVRFLEFQKPKVYWSATEKMNLNLLFQKEGVRKMIDDAFTGSGVVIERSGDLMEDLEISTLWSLVTSPANQKPLEGYQRDFLGQFFWDLGYFTLLKDVKSDFVELISPNLEIRMIMSEILAKSWMHYYGTKLQTVKDYIKSFMSLSNPTDSTYKAFENSIKALFPKSILPGSEFDLASTLHAFLLFEPKQYANYNITTMNGRANLIVCQRPKDGPKTGFILGLRYKDCKRNSPLKELQDAEYEHVFQEDEYKNVTQYILIGVCLNVAKQFEFSFFAKIKQ